jgi:general stress protein 26
MLGIEGSGRHMQPMAPQLDRKGRRIWFFTRNDSDLAQAVGIGAPAHFCIVGDIGGALLFSLIAYAQVREEI